MRVFGAAINAEIFVQVVEKLIRNKNVSRAIKLSNAAGDAPLGRATQAALLASVSKEDDNRPANYRGNRPMAIETVKARIRGRYDDAFTQAVAPLNIPFFLAIVALLLFVGVAILAAVQPVQDWKVVGAAGIGALVWLYTGSQHLKILGTRAKVFDALWPSLEVVYHDRHAIDLQSPPAYPWKEAIQPSAPEEPKPTLITFEILEPGQPLRTVPLDIPIIKIGKLATSHVQLSADKVARMHAVIEIADGTATVIDLGAEHQTKVNLEPVNKRELANGDVITIGEAELVVRLGSASAT